MSQTLSVTEVARHFNVREFTRVPGLAVEDWGGPR